MTPPGPNNKQWDSTSPSILDQYDSNYLEDQRKQFVAERVAQQQALYQQLTAAESPGSSKNRSARMAAIIARHRVI